MRARAPKQIQLIKRLAQTKIIRILLVVGVSAIVGMTGIFWAQAVTTVVQKEAESGSVAGNATTVINSSDTANASGNSQVRFGSLYKRFVSTTATGKLAAATSLEQAEQALQTWGDQYNLTIYVTSFPSTIRPPSYALPDETSLQDLKITGTLLIDEWSKYPPDFVEQSGLKGVSLGKDNYIDGTYRAAVYDNPDKLMVYDIKYVSTTDNNTYMRGVLHHEYWHYIESEDGVLGTTVSDWEDLNKPGFQYGNGGASCYEPGNDCLSGDHPVPGFVSGYGASSPDEDRAEYFAYLLVGERYHKVLAWMQSDSYVADKTALFKEILADHSPAMGGSYLDDVNGHIVANPAIANAHAKQRPVH